MATLSPRINGLSFEAKRRKAAAVASKKRSSKSENKMRDYDSPSAYFQTSLRITDRPPSDSICSSETSLSADNEEENVATAVTASPCSRSKGKLYSSRNSTFGSRSGMQEPALERSLQSPYEKGMGSGVQLPDIDVSKDSRKRLSFTPALDDSPKRSRLDVSVESLGKSKRNNSTFTVSPHMKQEENELNKNEVLVNEKNENINETIEKGLTPGKVLKKHSPSKSSLSAEKTRSSNKLENKSTQKTNKFIINNDHDEENNVTVVHYTTRASTQNKSSQKRDLKNAPKQKQYASMETQAGESKLHRRKTRQGNGSRSKKKESDVDFRKVVGNIGDNTAKEDSIKKPQGNKGNKRNTSKIHSPLESKLDSKTNTSSNIKEQSALRINDSRLTTKTDLNCSTRITRSMRGTDKSQSLSVFVHNVEQTLLKGNKKNNCTFIELFPEKKNAPKRAEKVLSKTMPTVGNASVENTTKLSTSQHNKTTGFKKKKPRKRICMPKPQKSKTRTETNSQGKSILKDTSSVSRRGNLHVTIMEPGDTPQIHKPQLKQSPKDLKKSLKSPTKESQQQINGSSNLPQSSRRKSLNRSRRESDYACDEAEIVQEDVNGYVPYLHSWPGYSDNNTSSSSKRGQHNKGNRQSPGKKAKKGNSSFERIFEDSRSFLSNETLKGPKEIICPVKNVATNTIEDLPLIRTAASVEWRPPVRNTGEEVFLHKFFSLPSLSFGQIKLNAFGRKGLQKTKHDNVFFYVLTGSIKLTLNQRQYHCVSGTTFIVPEGNLYDIENLENYEARLLFFQQKHV
ncbi:uncharacterized protein LOC130640892 isoform X2 [Hydractinia symbiolongicarpus]|uniref:uncharacterized protein LOC130640892 isoform X2 n=1 Tax=Hydractinia symbiolongicarpus TaxID=13093 RepID=UPI002549C23E|nr:uncharacterized protein LOC130640892 isoform X2 [Hydractinia symbiolongicarpus]